VCGGKAAQLCAVVAPVEYDSVTKQHVERPALGPTGTRKTVGKSWPATRQDILRWGRGKRTLERVNIRSYRIVDAKDADGSADCIGLEQSAWRADMGHGRSQEEVHDRVQRTMLMKGKQAERWRGQTVLLAFILSQVTSRLCRIGERRNTTPPDYPERSSACSLRGRKIATTAKKL
jgi:hypothetical protein